MLYLIVATIFFIFLDELIMGCAQRRMGPLNLGWYGILTSLINGCNLFIAQVILPKMNVNWLFSILFFIFAFFNLVLHYPFFLVDIYNSIIITLILTDIALYFNVLLAFSGFSKYSLLASIRIISQFISFELVFTTILLIFIWSFYNLLISSLWFVMLQNVW
jgi:NADH:ubiquinone oxidoreductase subunit H